FTASTLLYGQKFTGTLTGTVTDPTGAVVPGAEIKVTSQTTGLARTVVSNNDGIYAVPELNPDSYTVSCTKPGFKQTIAKDVSVHVADVRPLNLTLAVGTTTELVEVSAAAVALQTESGEVSSTMVSQQVQELPLNGRNFVQLTTLVPGAAVSETFDNKNKGLFAGVDISFSGSPSVNNQWTVDGAANNDIGSQRTILIYPSIDNIDEFKIQRNSYGPEYGGAAGAQVNVVTKGGGNNLHGDAYYFGRNDVLNAKNFFLANDCGPGDPSCTKQMARQNDWGYTLGGPIKKDKLFFFWSEEWNNQRRGVVHRHWVPSAAELAGNFNDLVGCPASSLAPALPVDPATGAPFPNNTIPANRLSPAGQAYLAVLPVPTRGPCNQFNWINQVKIPVNWREDSVRGDWNVTHKNTLMIRYTNDAWNNFLHADESAGLWGDSDYPALSDNWIQPGKGAVAKLTTTLTNTAVNDFQFSWSGNRINVTRGGDQPALNDKINSAMPRLFPFNDKLHGTQAAAPQYWTGGADPSGELGILSPWQNRQDLFVWK
ncbi:MAG TPA: carboxypeptidase-like regulatory domain-containing protein, partial [Terriglobales bacterium]|nr:carboxypeptidase-like regulatory domain-containing protein [Terriglobales bacterium]